MPKPNVKEQIIAASLELLHRRGFNATSVQDITAEAGVPKGSFYNHFTSKEAMGMEVLQRYTERTAEANRLLADTSLPAPERIANYYRQLHEQSGHTAFERGCMVGNFSTELTQQIPAMRVQLQQVYERTRSMLEQVITEGQQQGDISKDMQAQELAAFIVDAWQGAVLRSKTEQDGAPLIRFIDIVLRRILA